MKILLCHNFYQQPGGEDQSFLDEAGMLERRGHEVLRFAMHNDDVEDISRWELSRRTLWNADVYRQLRDLIRCEQPALMHCTNTFPLISPAAYYAAQAQHIPVVQSLRNFRLLCPNGLLLREGRPCEQCLGKWLAWRSIVHRCYRHDRLATAVVAGMVAAHRGMRTWEDAVDLYFTPSEFARRKFVQGGFAPDRIAVKPNFVYPDPGPGSGSGGYAVFVGRLSQEKGLDTLLAAWQLLPGRPLWIVGDGPLAPQVRSAVSKNPLIRWIGHRPHREVLSILGQAACLIMPSIWYETFGRSIVEAFASGTPVIASALGAMEELVDHGRTGLHFEPGNAAELAAKVQQLLDDPQGLARMRVEARDEYEQKYTEERNYGLLMGIYRQVLHLEPALAGL